MLEQDLRGPGGRLPISSPVLYSLLTYQAAHLSPSTSTTD
jgi:hypothetical protein